MKDGVKIIITRSGSEELRFLEYMNAKAFYGTGEGKGGAICLMEDAQDKLLQIGKKEGWSKEEMNEIVGAKKHGKNN